jgi:hypothetical protein
MSRDQQRTTTVVSGAFPSHLLPGTPLVETVRDPNDLTRFVFLRWQNAIVTMLPSIEHAGTVYVPPDSMEALHSQIILPTGVRPCREPAALIADIVDTLVKFIEADRELMVLLASVILCSWFPDCFEAVPYVWIVGPLGSAKTKLLRLLSCMCRRALLVGDVRAGSLYALTDRFNPTLLIDELDFDNSSRSADILRLLRTGTVAGVPAGRNGKLLSTYGVKIIASREVPRDAPLLSRCVIVSMLPTRNETLPLDDVSIRKIAHRFQPEMLMFRFANYSMVKTFRLPSNALECFTPRMKQVALALVAPIQNHTESESIVLLSLRDRDRDAEIERLLEPEWLAATILLELIHECPIHSILVGGIASSINAKLKFRGEDFRIGARKVGSVLKSLGLKTESLGRLGRGLLCTPAMNRQIHAAARHLGISRRTIATSPGLEAGYGGRRCLQCEEVGLTDGLRFDDPSTRLPDRANKDAPRRSSRRNSRSILHPQPVRRCKPSAARPRSPRQASKATATSRNKDRRGVIPIPGREHRGRL